VTPCSLADKCQLFGGICRLLLPDTRTSFLSTNLEAVIISEVDNSEVLQLAFAGHSVRTCQKYTFESFAGG
jgi:hypothetical protein